jgi:hypothetical protein
LRKYVHNTHAKTHQGYKLVVEQIFKVRRQGEEERFKPVRFQLETGSFGMSFGWIRELCAAECRTAH